MWNFFTNIIPKHSKTPPNKKSKSRHKSSILSSGLPMWSLPSYNHFSFEGYRSNPIVYRCIKEISNACSSIKYILYNEQKQEITKHPILNILNQPNPQQCYGSFIETIICYHLLAGNVYIEAIGEPVEELYVLRPDRIKIIPGMHGMPLFYEYYVDQQVVKFPVNQVSGESAILHWKNFNPTDEWYGMAPIESVSKSIDIHNQGNQWNKALLDHSCRPCGALVTNEELTEEQYQRLQEQLRSQYQGPQSAGKTFIFEGGISWTDMSISPKDMDFMKCMQNAAREIAFGLGVPPMLIGLPGDNTYSNQKEARLALWEQTIIPIVKNFCNSISNWLSKKFQHNQQLRLEPDLGKISVLSERRQYYWNNIIEGVKNNVISINEARIALGYTSITTLDDTISNIKKSITDSITNDVDNNIKSNHLNQIVDNSKNTNIDD